MLQRQFATIWPSTVHPFLFVCFWVASFNAPSYIGWNENTGDESVANVSAADTIFVPARTTAPNVERQPPKRYRSETLPPMATQHYGRLLGVRGD